MEKDILLDVMYRFLLRYKSIDLDYITLNKVLHVFDFQLDDWYYHFEFAAYTMAYSNSVLNPIIYAGFNENFKQGKHK